MSGTTTGCSTPEGKPQFQPRLCERVDSRGAPEQEAIWEAKVPVEMEDNVPEVRISAGGGVPEVRSSAAGAAACERTQPAVSAGDHVRNKQNEK